MTTPPRANDESDMEHFTRKFQRMIRRDKRSSKKNFIPKQAYDEYESIISLMANSDPDGEDEKVKKETDGGGQKCYMDSSCSKHMISKRDNFLSLKAFQVGSVSFGNGKKGNILGVSKVEWTLAHAIENAYFVNGLKYGLLNMSQICERGNEFKFLSCSCTVTSLKTGEVVLVAKRFENVYVTNFGSQDGSYLTCLRAIEEELELWHTLLGHANFSLLRKHLCERPGSRITKGKV
ncbi:uncharacterized protein LOC132034564 [Lycium ferocissimum]|uniref:uncharacterized protein LOC132034564 n=1 Tax=Lycium ferocissimum TaxID=112874 RepID=UPI002816296E|nr:uncharacterized protein LOC132034564 [Lycium ferocissimum]